MILKTDKPYYSTNGHKKYMYVWNLPFIPQYQGYKRSWHFTCPKCNNNMGAEWEELKGIVGYSEDSYGDLLILHECPRCGTKWYNHVSHESDSELNRFMLLEMLLKSDDYRVANPNLLIKKEEVKGG